MNGKLVIILAGALTVAGCDLVPDPTVFPLSRNQVQAMLMDARTTMPRRDDAKEKIKIWGEARTSKGVRLNMKYASWAPLLECEAVITVIKPEETRVVADCGKSANANESARARTQDQLRAPMFEEHIASTLNKRPFDRSKVTAKETAAVFKNLNGMQNEALQMAADEAKLRAAARSR